MSTISELRTWILENTDKIINYHYDNDKCLQIFCKGCNLVISQLYETPHNDIEYSNYHDMHDLSICSCGQCSEMPEITQRLLIETHFKPEDYKTYDLDRLTPNNYKPSIDIEFEQQAKKFLHDPELLNKIVSEIEINVKNDTKIIKEILYVELSRLTQNPQNLIVSHNPSTGKSFTVLETLKVFPQDWYETKQAPSPKSLFNEGQFIDDYTRLIELNKSQIILEGKECEEFLNQIKPILSHDLEEIHIKTVMKVKSKNVTVTTIIRGWTPFIIISAKPLKDLENSSRAWITEPNSDTKKYELAIKNQAKKRSMPWLYNDDGQRFNVIQKAISMLKKYDIWNPFSDLLAEHLPKNSPDNMRLSERFWSAIESRTLLYQFQRDIITIDDKEYLVTKYDDIIETIKDCYEMIQTSKSGLQTHQIKFFKDVLMNMDDMVTYKHIIDKAREVIKRRIPETTLKRSYIKPLVEYGLITIHDKHKPHQIEIHKETLTTFNQIENFDSENTMVQTLTNINQNQPLALFPSLIKDNVIQWLVENMPKYIMEKPNILQILGLHTEEDE